MSGEHAPLAPSSAPQWGHCSGHVMAAAQAPELESESSRRGTAAHWVGSEVLGNFQSPQEGLPILCSDFIGKTAPNGVVIDDEMAEGADIYTSDVLAVAQEHGAVQKMLVEHRVHAPQIHDKNWGTLDCAIPLIDEGVIYLWDYKNGHRETRAKGNLQLVNYMAGLYAELNINGLQDQHIRVVMRIVQPFCYKAKGAVDEWSFLLSDLRAYFNQLHAKAHEAFDKPTLSTGPWCRDCPAVKNCSAARRAAYNLIDYVNAPYQMDTMTGAELAVERTILENGLVAAKARAQAIEDELHSRVSDGATDTGLSLEASRGRSAWTIPVEQAVALAGQFGADISKPGVKTPTQSVAAVPRELRQQFEQVLATVTHRPAGGLKLIEAGDTLGARVFKRKNQ